MAGKQKSGGGAKKYSRDKVKCATYKNRGIREQNKLAEFKKHNIPKDIDEESKKKLISEFKTLQGQRKKEKK